jgi:hypothetical protein
MPIQPDSTSVAIARETLYWARVQGWSEAVLAVLGLASVGTLFVTRWGLLSQAKRSKVEDAARLCEEMRTDIVPLLEAFVAHRTKRFVSDGGKVTFPTEIDDAKAEQAAAWVAALPPEARTISLRLLNRLETWALHFNTGLADSDVAFLPCGTIYCTVVVLLYASIITQRHNNPSSGPYQNVVDLFGRWYKRQRMEKIQAEVDKLEGAGVFKATPPRRYGAVT